MGDKRITGQEDAGESFFILMSENIFQLKVYNE